MEASQPPRVADGNFLNPTQINSHRPLKKLPFANAWRLGNSLSILYLCGLCVRPAHTAKHSKKLPNTAHAHGVRYLRVPTAWGGGWEASVPWATASDRPSTPPVPPPLIVSPRTRPIIPPALPPPLRPLREASGLLQSLIINHSSLYCNGPYIPLPCPYERQGTGLHQGSLRY